jgi:hypothetical protein
MADEYVLTHTLIFWKNKRAGSLPNLNYVQNRILLITILINQHQVLGRKNKNSYTPPEINKRGNILVSCKLVLSPISDTNHFVIKGL